MPLGSFLADVYVDFKVKDVSFGVANATGFNISSSLDFITLLLFPMFQALPVAKLNY